MQKVISIDVGMNGSICILNFKDEIESYYNKFNVFQIEKAKITDVRFYQIEEKKLKRNIDFFMELLKTETKQENIIFIEKVHSNIDYGVKSSFSFGFAFGKITTILEILKIKYYEVPVKWRVSLFNFLKIHYVDLYQTIKKEINKHEKTKKQNIEIAKILLYKMYARKITNKTIKYLENHHNADAFLIAITGIVRKAIFSS